MKMIYPPTFGSLLCSYRLRRQRSVSIILLAVLQQLKTTIDLRVRPNLKHLTEMKIVAKESIHCSGNQTRIGRKNTQCSTACLGAHSARNWAWNQKILSCTIPYRVVQNVS